MKSVHQRYDIRRRSGLKTVGFIPARGGSKSIENKNLVKVNGYTLVANAILVLRAAGIKNIWVSTDDKNIAKEAKLFGAEVIDRPTKIATDDSSTEKAIEHFLNKVDCDIVIMVQATSPMLSPKDIYNGFERLLGGDYDSLFSAVVTNDVLVWDKSMTPLNYNLHNRQTKQTRKNITLIETGGFYIFYKKIFMKKKNRLAGKIGYCSVPFWESFQIDSPRDLIFVERLLRK